MKHFLPLKRAASFPIRNISKLEIPQEDVTELCGKCYALSQNPDDPYVLGVMPPEQVIVGNCFCHDSTGYASFLFGEGLIVEGILPNGTKLAPVQDAWGISNAFFKVTFTKQTMFTGFINYIQLLENVDSESYRTMVFLKNWEGTISTRVDIKTVDPLDKTLDYDILYTLGSNVKTSYKSKNRIRPFNQHIGTETLPDPLPYEDTMNGIFQRVFVTDEDVDYSTQKDNTQLSLDASVSINITERFDFMPEINYELKPNMIFDNSIQDLYPAPTPPEEDPDDGLSGGAIAGIVIACVVVVAVVVFCVVWFVVLKKGCCGGGKNAEADA